MSGKIDPDRRHFLGTVAMTIAAAQFGMIDSASATQSSKAAVPPVKAGTNASFASLKQIDAGVLNVGYAETGPAGRSGVILLHGWPYDIHSFVDVAPLLASAGGLSGDRPIRARLRDDALPFRCNVPQWAAVGPRCRYHRLDGYSQNREGDPGRFRLGSADGQHHRSALAGALHGNGVRERLSDR